MSLNKQLETLKVFVLTVECGSISKASQQLGLPSNTVLHSIDQLESSLGTSLFNRSTKQITLTSKGETCYQDAVKILEGWHSLSDVADFAKPALVGDISVSVPISWGLMHFSNLVKNFQNNHPEVNIHVDLNDELVNLPYSEFDFVLKLSSNLKESGMLCTKLCELDFVLCATPNYLSANALIEDLADLSDHHHLVYAQPYVGTARWEFTVDDHTEVIHPTSSSHSNNSLYLKQQALNHLGITYVPRFLVEEELASGQLVSLLANYKTKRLGLYLINRTEGVIPRRTKALIDYLIEVLKK